MGEGHGLSHPIQIDQSEPPCPHAVRALNMTSISTPKTFGKQPSAGPNWPARGSSRNNCAPTRWHHLVGQPFVDRGKHWIVHSVQLDPEFGAWVAFYYIFGTDLPGLADCHGSWICTDKG